MTKSRFGISDALSDGKSTRGARKTVGEFSVFGK